MLLHILQCSVETDLRGGGIFNLSFLRLPERDGEKVMKIDPFC